VERVEEMAEVQPKQSGLLVLSVVAALLGGGWLMLEGTKTEHPPQPSGADAFQSTPNAPNALFEVSQASASPSATHSATPPPVPMAASVPVRIKIPSIEVNAPLTQLGLDSTGHLAVPPDNNKNLAGWYKNGPTPGSAGNALIDGHVDNMKGPAVFYNLGALHKNDTIEVDRQDGSAAVFGIDAVEVYEKNAFPDQKVYGSTADPELRVITCGGGYSKKKGYQGNVVVYAHLVQAKPHAG